MQGIVYLEPKVGTKNCFKVANSISANSWLIPLAYANPQNVPITSRAQIFLNKLFCKSNSANVSGVPVH